MIRLIGIYDYTVIITYISLISSIYGMTQAIHGDYKTAIFCLAFSGFCDAFDGRIARTKKNRTQEEKDFGIQLDSLCDVVCFGVFPSVLLYFSGVDSVAGIALLIFYILCALIRLAFFSVLETKRQMTEDGCAKDYRGLPVTTSAIIYPFVFLVGAFLPEGVKMVVYYAVPVVVGCLFVLDVRIPKIDFGKILFGKKK